MMEAPIIFCGSAEGRGSGVSDAAVCPWPGVSQLETSPLQFFETGIEPLQLIFLSRWVRACSDYTLLSAAKRPPSSISRLMVAHVLIFLDINMQKDAWILASFEPICNVAHP